MGCAYAIDHASLLSHLRSQAARHSSVASEDVAYQRGDFEQRWHQLLRPAIRRIEAEYEAERAEDVRSGRVEYSRFANLYATYAERLRFAAELSRRLAADGYGGELPSGDCRPIPVASLERSACLLSAATSLRGTRAQAAYLAAIAEPGVPLALSIDYGIFLKRNGRLEESVQILQAVASEAQRRGDKPVAAHALHNLGNALADLDRLVPAVNAYEAAIDLLRKSAHGFPDYWIDLSTTLNNYHTVLLDLGRDADAESVLREAFRIRLRLASASPETYLPNLAVTLTNFALLRETQGRYGDAVLAAELATGIYRRLEAETYPASDLELARTLLSLAHYYLQDGNPGQAEAAAREAASAYRTLIRRDVPLHAERAAALSLLAGLRTRPGGMAAAAENLDDSISTLRFLAARDQKTFWPALITSLANLTKGLAAKRAPRQPTL